MRAFRLCLPLAVIAVVLAAMPAFASDLRQVGMINIPGEPGFSDLAFIDNMLVMTHPGASSIDIFDPVRRRVIAQITGVQGPRGIAIDEKAGRFYVACAGSNSILVVSTDGWKAVDSIVLQGTPNQLLLDGTGKIFWTDARARTISLLDLSTKQDVARAQLDGTPRDLAFDAGRHLLFVTLQDTHQVVALDSDLKVANRFTLNASQPTGLIYDPQYHQLYVAARYAVLSLNADTGAETGRVPAPAGVDALWLDPDSHMLYAASEGTLMTIQAKGSLRSGEEVLTQVKGHTVAYDADKNLILVPGGREGRSKMLIYRPMTGNAQQNALPGQTAF